MRTNLEHVAIDFLMRRLEAECIDDLTLTRAQKENDLADFFLLDRTVVVELKSLVDDRGEGLRKIIEKRRGQKDWPIVWWESDIQDVLRTHPEREEINRELFDCATRSVEASFRKANRQIRVTKSSFGIPDALGMLVLVNDSVDVLDPQVLMRKIGNLLLKRDANGRIRFPDLDWVLLISWAHEVINEGVPQGHIIMSATRPGSELPDGFDEVQRAVMAAWAAFLNLPLQDGGVITNMEDASKIKVVSKKPPTVF